MRYRITHTTVYSYSQPVGLCQNEARLQPRDFWRQQCQSSRFEINPAPTNFSERIDYFGNNVTYFAVQQAHTQLSVTCISDIMVSSKPNEILLDTTLPWERVRDLLFDSPQPTQVQNQASQGQSQQQGVSAEQSLEHFEARQYLLDSPMINTTPELTEYARSSFLPGRPLVAAVQDLMQRIFTDFTYDPSFTTIATPLSEVFAHRRGVCQDFAHLAISCIRAYGIAARYVSGYVETLPAPGKQRLVGADASHAWFAVYIPGYGWLDFDPTNNILPKEQHVTLAWGRDFSDVTPLKGIAFGGGQHTLAVSVDVLPLPSEHEHEHPAS